MTITSATAVAPGQKTEERDLAGEHAGQPDQRVGPVPVAAAAQAPYMRANAPSTTAYAPHTMTSVVSVKPGHANASTPKTMAARPRNASHPQWAESADRPGGKADRTGRVIVIVLPVMLTSGRMPALHRYTGENKPISRSPAAYWRISRSCASACSPA